MEDVLQVGLTQLKVPFDYSCTFTTSEIGLNSVLEPVKETTRCRRYVAYVRFKNAFGVCSRCMVLHDLGRILA